jgi:radical SAM protein with 4Fe4S-binding SPASM domain
MENAIGPDDMKMAVEEVMRQRKRFSHLTFLTYFDVLGKSATYHHPIDKFNDPCPARKNGFITYGGDFFPCDFLRYAGQRYYCGNILKEGFAYLWENSSNLRAFQGLKHVKCKRCKHYMKTCYGGCISGSIASIGAPDDALCFVDVNDK